MATTPIILLRDMRGLGVRGDVVSVKPGYARNYLLPQGFALNKTKANAAFFEQQRSKIDAVHQKERDEAAQIAADLADVRVKIRKRVGESEVLYGSVTTSEIAEKLASKGIKVDKRRLELPEGVPGLKSLGEHIVTLDLHAEVVAEITVVVEAEE